MNSNERWEMLTRTTEEHTRTMADIVKIKTPRSLSPSSIGVGVIDNMLAHVRHLLNYTFFDFRQFRLSEPFFAQCSNNALWGYFFEKKYWYGFWGDKGVEGVCHNVHVWWWWSWAREDSVRRSLESFLLILDFKPCKRTCSKDQNAHIRMKGTLIRIRLKKAFRILGFHG